MPVLENKASNLVLEQYKYIHLCIYIRLYAIREPKGADVPDIVDDIVNSSGLNGENFNNNRTS